MTNCEQSPRVSTPREKDPGLPKDYFVNPIDNRNSPDPSMYWYMNTLFRACTQTEPSEPEGRLFVPVSYSPTGVEWKHRSEALEKIPAWSSGDIWAPEFIQRQKDKAMIISVSAGMHPQRGTGHVFANGILDRKTGLYTLADAPMVDGITEGFSNIDSSFFPDHAEGQTIMYWGSGGEPIKAGILAPDMMSWDKRKQPREVLEPTGKMYLLEAPTVLYNHNSPYKEKYVMYASVGDCCHESGKYSVVIALGMTAMGPFRIIETFLESSADFANPGHHCFIRNIDGSLFYDEEGNAWAACHAVEPHQFNADGTPKQPLVRCLCLMPAVPGKDGILRVKNQQVPVQEIPRPVVANKNAIARVAHQVQKPKIFFMAA